MRKKRDPETDECRKLRTELHARERIAQAAAEDKSVEAAIRNSIKLHGA